MSETLLKRNASTNAKTTNGIPLKDTSQATYFFDCTNSWFNRDGTNKGFKTENRKKIPNVPFGSFCCILKKGNEHFILTAGHNLKNTSDKEYKLINDNKNYVELVLVKDYRILTEQEKQINDDLQKQGEPFKYFSHDAAVLKINKITEEDKIVYDITDASTKNDDITKSTDFYGMAKKFNNVFFDPDSIADGKNMEFVGYISKYKNNSDQEFKGKRKHQDSEIEPKGTVYYATTKIGDTGDSGGLMFNNKTIQGIYLGNNKVDKEESGLCRTIDSLNLDKVCTIC